MPTQTKHKPKKPYPSFPLTPHPNGQWCKKIRGKIHFFGVWADPDAALSNYHAQAADLHDGRQPQPKTLTDGPATVKDVCNAYLTWQAERLESRDIGARWFEDCRSILSQFASAVGKSRVADELRPLEFQRYRTRLANRLGVHALTRHIVTIKSAFRYAHDTDLLDTPMKFGRVFAPPTAAQKRKARSTAEASNGKRLFSCEELNTILDNCPAPVLRAAILLGINGGFGNTDCATLPLSAINLEEQLISYARPKTGVQRVVPLWKETRDALKTAIQDAPRPENAVAARLALRSVRGKPLVRQSLKRTDEHGLHASNVDQLSADFTELLKTLGFWRPRIGFYTLRHTFRTWADEVHDQHAIHRIMGHAIPGMSGIYVEEISLDRLRAVTDHVRGKVFI